jgi:hydrogenase-4 membrane subunit HyfE
VNKRTLFWNYLLKTSLSGEFVFPGRYRMIVNRALGIFLLALIPFFVFGAVDTLRRRFSQGLPLLLSLVLLLAASMTYRVRLSSPGAAEFRLIYPAVITFCAFFGSGCEALARSSVKWPAYAGMLAGWLLVGFSLLFSLLPF